MRYIIHCLLIITALSISGCATNQNQAENKTPEANESTVDPKKWVAAKHFIQNIGAGEFTVLMFERELNNLSRENPALGEFVSRVFSDISKDDFENIAADVYARFVSLDDLLSLSAESEDPAIAKYFAAAFDMALKEEKPESANLLQDFNVDEITKLMHFLKSDSFERLSKQFPIINEEIKLQGRKHGEKLLKRYLENNPNVNKDAFI